MKVRHTRVFSYGIWDFVNRYDFTLNGEPHVIMFKDDEKQRADEAIKSIKIDINPMPVIDGMDSKIIDIQ